MVGCNFGGLCCVIWVCVCYVGVVWVSFGCHVGVIWVLCGCCVGVMYLKVVMGMM